MAQVKVGSVPSLSAGLIEKAVSPEVVLNNDYY